jgi:hypothetical protein
VFRQTRCLDKDDDEKVKETQIGIPSVLEDKPTCSNRQSKSRRQSQVFTFSLNSNTFNDTTTSKKEFNRNQQNNIKVINLIISFQFEYN